MSNEMQVDSPFSMLPQPHALPRVFKPLPEGVGEAWPTRPAEVALLKSCRKFGFPPPAAAAPLQGP